jgi:hypothetical protein
MQEQPAEVWRTNNRFNLYPIEHVSTGGVSCSLA